MTLTDKGNLTTIGYSVAYLFNQLRDSRVSYASHSSRAYIDRLARMQDRSIEVYGNTPRSQDGLYSLFLPALRVGAIQDAFQELEGL